MSITLMTAAFKTKIPTTQKFVFVALCDNANDQGECYPSVKMICEKTSLKERAVRSAFNWLMDHGFMYTERRKGASNYFYIASPEKWHYEPDPCTKCTPASNAPLHNMHDAPASNAPQPLHEMQDTPAPDAPITINEPSIEPSINHHYGACEKKPSGFSPTWLTTEGVDQEIAEAFVAVRKAKKAPMTKLAVDALKREAQKAGITLSEAARFAAENGYQSFQARYLGTRNTQRFDDSAQRKAAFLAKLNADNKTIEGEARWK